MGVLHEISKPDIKSLIEIRDIDGLLRIVTFNDYIGFSEMIFPKACTLGGLDEIGACKGDLP
jgi:hypothetical protein